MKKLLKGSCLVIVGVVLGAIWVGIGLGILDKRGYCIFKMTIPYVDGDSVFTLSDSMKNWKVWAKAWLTQTKYMDI